METDILVLFFELTDSVTKNGFELCVNEAKKTFDQNRLLNVRGTLTISRTECRVHLPLLSEDLLIPLDKRAFPCSNPEVGTGLTYWSRRGTATLFDIVYIQPTVIPD